jgi:hypothetical protein
LGLIAVRIAAKWPVRAVEVFEMAQGEHGRNRAVSFVGHLASVDPSLAERVARSLSEDAERAAALRRIACLRAIGDPAGAARLFREVVPAEELRDDPTGMASLTVSFADGHLDMLMANAAMAGDDAKVFLAELLAVDHPLRAQVVADQIFDRDRRGQAYASVLRSFGHAVVDRSVLAGAIASIPWQYILLGVASIDPSILKNLAGEVLARKKQTESVRGDLPELI